MSDDRPVLVVNSEEWTPKLIAEAERDGFDVKPNRWCPRRTAYIIKPDAMLHGAYTVKDLMEESGLSAHPTSDAEG